MNALFYEFEESMSKYAVYIHPIYKDLDLKSRDASKRLGLI